MCGGVISQTMDRKLTRKHGVYATMMCYILPDDKYKEYVKLKKSKNDKEASKIFNKYAHSII